MAVWGPSVQPPNSGSLEQILRCMKALALCDQFGMEMQTLAYRMGPGAFKPWPDGLHFTAADGSTFAIPMDDEEYGPPSSWIPTEFAEVRIVDNQALQPPYPRLDILVQQGRLSVSVQGLDAVADVGDWAEVIYYIDLVVATQMDRPKVAARAAGALLDGYSRLLMRNKNLGGLVGLVQPAAPPAPNAEQLQEGGLVCGVTQRYHIHTQYSIF